MCGQRRLAGRALLLQPRQHGGFLGLLLASGVDALEAFQLAQVVLGHVVHAGGSGGVLHLDVGVGLAGVGDHLQHRVVVLGDGRVGEAGGLVELAGQCIAVGAARVAGHHHEVVGAQRLVGELQEVLGLVRHVVGGEGGRLAVLADVGAVEREIAGVAWPHPVVDVAAELADAARGRVDQAHVLDFHVAEQAVGVAAGEAVQAAAETGIGFTGGNLGLVEGVQRAAAGQRVVAGSGDGGLGLGGDVGDLVEHEHAGVRAGAQFVLQGRRIEAVLDQVLLRGRIQLDGAIRAMVVGDHQALRRDEAGGAAAEGDDRAHRVAGQVGQLFRGQLQAGLLQRAGDFRQLLRHPHAFSGMGDLGQAEAGDDGKCKQVRAHGAAPGSGTLDCSPPPCPGPNPGSHAIRCLHRSAFPLRSVRGERPGRCRTCRKPGSAARPSRWRLCVRALAKQCFASKAPSPMGARSRHPWRSRSCIGLAPRLPTVPWPRTVAPSHARRAKRRCCLQYVRNARRRTPFVPPKHPQRNMGIPSGTL